ncbi:hypothetical protein AB0L71_06900 [Streptomyces sp. NPDC052052]|uniref:hypothetical protein n=1 Tax=Streptomyces sp. NPDC052052 TaxID=3154756 RepID=UPI00341E1EB5
MTDQVPVVTPAAVFDAKYAPALVGGSAVAERFTVGGADVVIGPTGMVITTDASDDPTRSGVWSAKEVRLLGPAPAPVTERLIGSPSGAETSLPIHIAVRVEAEVLYLGTARVSQGGTSNGVLTDCQLRLESCLSRSLLDRVRPTTPPVNLPGSGWLRHVNSDRAAALEEFVTDWYPAVGDAPGSPSIGPVSPLPDGLRQLYRLAEQRPGVLGVQNRIRPESRLHVDQQGEMIVFGEENQGGFCWSLLWAFDDPGSDPTVWFCVDGGAPIAEQEPLSGFLIQFSLFEAAMSADYLALPRRLLASWQVDQLTQTLRAVPLRPFWPWAPTRFFVGPGLVMYVSREGNEEFGVWAGATHRSALDPLAEFPIEWTRFDG